jgi:uncharacterized protein YdaU (DUF1376 family)
MPMSKDSNIWFPLYADSFLSHTIHLNNTSLGIYIRLLTVCFLQKDCHLQVRNLHKICGYSNGIKWQTIWTNDLEELFIYNNDKTKVTNKRLFEEFNKINDMKSRRQASSKIANEVRWNKTPKQPIRPSIRLGSNSDPYIELESERIKEIKNKEKKRLDNIRSNAAMLNNGLT